MSSEWLPADRDERVGLEQVRLPEPALPGRARERLVSVLGDGLSFDRAARVGHAVGRGYPDLVRMRAGDASSAPDAVASPASTDALRAVLAACSEEQVALVPFGGGTSVVGGVEPLRDGFAAAVSLDLRRLNRIRDVDRTSLTATFEAGLLGPRRRRNWPRTV